MYICDDGVVSDGVITVKTIADDAAAWKRNVNSVVKRIHETLVVRCMYMTPPIACCISERELSDFFGERVSLAIERINNVLIALGFGCDIVAECKRVGSWYSSKVDRKVWTWRANEDYACRFAHRTIVDI
jgi:hypothetical protein